MTDWSPRYLTNKHRLLFGVIPEIECPPGCDLCCEYLLALALRDRGGKQYGMPYEFYSIEYFEDNRTNACHFHDKGRCSKYIDRPLVCRIFWRIEGDPPCHGGQEPKRYLTKEETRRLFWCWNWGTEQDARALVAWMRRA